MYFSRMCDFDGNFMWAPPSSPSPRTILMVLNQTDNGLNLMNEIFPQANLSNDHIDQSEERPGLGERLTSRLGFNLPTLDPENISPFSALFRNHIVPSPITQISLGFSPSSLLQSPNMFSNSSQLDPPYLNTKYGPPVMVACSNEGNATTPIFNNDLPHQPKNFDLLPQEYFCEIPTDESVYIPSHESHVKPFVAQIVASFESNLVEEINNNIPHQHLNVDLTSKEESIVEPLSIPLVASFERHAIDEAHNDFPNQPLNGYLPPQEESESDAVDKVNIISMEEESESVGEAKNDEEKVEDREIIDVDELNDGSSSSKRRKFEGTNMIGTTRKNKTQRVILYMESKEDNPDDGFRWIKYGQKVVKGNPNTRSYYKCKSNGCKVKKHIERGAEDDRLVSTTYDDIHHHPTPHARRRGWGSCSMNRSNSPISQNWINQNASWLSRPPSLFITSPNMRTAFSSLGPETDMARLSKLPSLQVNHQNLGFTNWNEEPMIDAIPDGTAVYNRIWSQVYANFGTRLSFDML